MDKKQAIRIIYDCAKLYSDNFLNKNLMIIFGKEEFGYIETSFPKVNFLHLTGVFSKLKATTFWHKCMNNNLLLSDFDFKKDGTTILKLEILPHILKPGTHCNMIGEYGKNKHFLHTEKLVGGVHACWGFIERGKYFVPNTSLQENIKNITEWNARIVLILEKGLNDDKYSSITYTAKNVDVAEVIQKLNSDKVELLLLPL